MKTQGKRSICILLAFILTVQMTFAPDITVFAAETPIVPSNPYVQINGLSLVLNGEIGLTFYVYVAKPYRGGVMVLEFMDEEPITMDITDCPQDNSTHLYPVTYYLRAIELSEPVTLTVYAENDTAHKYPLARKSCSAEDYVNLLMGDEEATESEKNVGKKLINYGHYAQLACSEANGWKIGEDYAETSPTDELAADPSVFDGYKIEWLNRTATVDRFSMSLQLDYKTGIRLYFPLAEKPTVTVKSKSAGSAPAQVAEVTESERLENNYEIFIDGINALNLEDKYEITVNDAAFTLSALSYCHWAVFYHAGENTIDAMRALYEFYQATVDYQTSKGA